MVKKFDRVLAIRLCMWKIWTARTVMRQPDIVACWGTQWLLKLMKYRQEVDELKHAPCCPANHYHRMRLVFHPCSCGAT
jgi:hypothetical protein